MATDNTLYKNKYRIDSTRLKDWDYSNDGYYFITACVKHRICCLGEVIDYTTVLSEQGKIVKQCWDNLPKHYPHITLDEFQIMPNHIHGIIIIEGNKKVETIHESSLRNNEEYIKTRRKMLLSKIMGRLMMRSAKLINIYQNTTGKGFWQRPFRDHIIRDEEALYNIRKYIRYNPLKWDDDRNNPNNFEK